MSRARIHDPSLFCEALSRATIHDPSLCGVGLLLVACMIAINIDLNAGLLIRTKYIIMY